MLAWLDDSTPFPDPRHALPDGLLAVGSSLTPRRLSQAYSKGIFPWFNEGDPVLWWSPDPRMVLRVDDFRPSASLRKKLRQIARQEQTENPPVRVTLNAAFERVIQACAAPRRSQAGTWISPQLQQAYLAWHQAGRVHSVETWINGKLAGGLYGVGLGRYFFGESMFSLSPDASKIALAYLVSFLRAQGIQEIDCQQETAHLASLGARPVAREKFLAALYQALASPTPSWTRGTLLHTGRLAPT